MQMLACVPWAIAGFITAALCQAIFIPLLVTAIGKGRFVALSAFDGYTLPARGGIAGYLLAVLLTLSGRSMWWTIPIVALCFTLYGIVWLWSLGGGDSQEWKIEEGQVVGQNKNCIMPLFLWEKSQYNQTDAFSGWSNYWLTLYDADGELASNGYIDRENYKIARNSLFEAVPTCRALDLTLVWRAEPLRWMRSI